MKKTKTDAKGQVYMTEADTPLSIAADSFMDAEDALVQAKEAREARMQDLRDAMVDSGQNKISHNGYILVLRKGHITKDTIALKRG
jgi:hypothetical protein